MHVGQRICESDYIIIRLCEFVSYGQPKGGREFRPLYSISCVYLVKNIDPDIDHRNNRKTKENKCVDGVWDNEFIHED